MKETFEKILAANINYIKKVADSLGYTDDEDLIQIGRISLYQSYHNYNPELSDNFMKYAGMNVRCAMMHYLSYNSRTIRIPYSQLQTELKLEKQARNYNFKMLSTDKTVYKDSDKTLGDTLVDVEDDEAGVDEDQKEALYDAIKQLKPKHRKLIEMRYGINQPLEKEHTLVEIGALYGDSKENIRQTMLRAEKQLKEILLQAA